jgi:hypothetical protein
VLKRSAARASATAVAQNQRKLSAQPVDRASLELGIETVIVIAGMESCQRRAWPEAGCAHRPREQSMDFADQSVASLDDPSAPRAGVKPWGPLR